MNRSNAAAKWNDCDRSEAAEVRQTSGSGELALTSNSHSQSAAVIKLPVKQAQICVSKRLFDVIGAFSILICTLPLLLVIGIAIRFSGSPVFFSHSRIGLNHRSFRCYKFRTMVPDAEERLKELLSKDAKVLREWRINHKLRNDPRVTRFGKFLRVSSMDELPQLWNVLKGDMSLIGPRPIVADELERYGNKARDYCSVKPGMTGFWQVLGRSNVTYSRRVSLDVLYIRRQSFRVDCWVLWRTLFVVLNRFGAY